MGQDQSAEERQPASVEELTAQLTNRFAKKCYTQLEIYCFQHLFTSLADSSSGLQHFSESTLARFLELPDILFGAGSVLFQMATWLGAFPFPSQAPAILTKEAMLRVITLASGRYAEVLPGLDGRRGRRRWWAELYRSLAVYDRGIGEPRSAVAKEATDAGEKEKEYSGFAVDAPGDDAALFGVGDDDDEDDGLMLAALDSMSALEAFGQGEKADVQHSFIPTDNFLRLIELLLLLAPLGAQDSLAAHAAKQLVPIDGNDTQRTRNLEELRESARSVLSSFGNSTGGPGIRHKAFTKAVESSMPMIFDGLGPLFEHFLFAKDFDLSKRRMTMSAVGLPPTEPPVSPTSESAFSPRVRSKSTSHSAITSPVSPNRPPSPAPALLPEDSPEMLSFPILSQLSFFLPPPKPFGTLVSLFAGSTHGFSMGAFEKHVFNWEAPSILLVSGTLLPPHPTNARERAFAESLPLKTLPTSHSRLQTDIISEPAARAVTSPASPTFPKGRQSFSGALLPPQPDDNDHDRPRSRASSTSSYSNTGEKVLYGAYIPTPWKSTPKTPFSTSQTLLFSLRPTHSVHRASTSSTDYAYFNKPGLSRPTGLGLGSPIQSGSGASTSGISGRRLPLGPVSLHLDDGLEFGVFTHLSEGGGSFLPNALPASPPRPSDTSTTDPAAQASSAVEGASPDFRDVFLVEDVLVLGVGGKEDEDVQRRRWKWEEREAERRRNVNFQGSGDVEADRELLRMAGLVGQHSRSGGSMA